MTISKNYILKEVAGNIVVVPVGSATVNFNAIIYLNDVGAFIFKLLQENDYTIDEVVDKILEEYNTTKEQAKADAENFCNKLKENNILN